MILLATCVSGCLFGSRATRQPEPPPVSPLVTLSSEQIHSPTGDMSARVPLDWVLLEADKLESPQIFAAAANPSYSLSLIFSEAPNDNATRSAYLRDGLQGVLSISFQRKVKRSNGRATMVGQPEDLMVGRKRFVAYLYTTDSMQSLTRVALFNTSSHIYECALTHLTFRADSLPGMAQLREIHQTVLGGIDW